VVVADPPGESGTDPPAGGHPAPAAS
jgi:hypothetical protein